MGTEQEKEAWVVFVGLLDLQIARNFASLLANAPKDFTRIHLLIHSPGGSISDGVLLFNLLKSFPMDVVAYNCGNVSSAAAIAYLGAKKRIVSPNGTFMFHRTKPQPGNVGHLPVLTAIADSVAMDDARTEEIIRNCATLTQEQWTVFAHADLTLDAEAAVTAGIAHEIGAFCPAGPIYTI